MFFDELINRASEFAAVAHRKQMRKSPEAQIPYIHHPLMVGFILQRAGFDEQVVAAGVLHDVIEDTEYGYEHLEARFGTRVAELVNAVSEQDKTLAWEERKERYLDHLAIASDDAKAITAADKIHNIQSILLSLKRGSDIWSAFKRGREAQLERFGRLVRLLERSWSHPLLDELGQALQTLRSQS